MQCAVQPLGVGGCCFESTRGSWATVGDVALLWRVWIRSEYELVMRKQLLRAQNQCLILLGFPFWPFTFLSPRL